VVHVVLNRLGRRLLLRRLGGLGVTLRVRGETFNGNWLRAHRLRVHLYPQHVLIIPIVWPFETAGSLLIGQSRRIVLAAAGEIRHARRVTCIGYTDDRGGWSYNLGLGRRRAEIVCKTLRALGVHASLSVATRGAAQPRATNGTAAGRALNRRVELRVSY
jgi:outer membrane protein OmpA-like peptidoglycan-associated protein